MVRSPANLSHLLCLFSVHAFLPVICHQTLAHPRFITYPYCMSTNESTDRSSEARPPRRKRGGQPGNQNARKHGFYSTAPSAREQGALQEAIVLKDLSSEIALMRVKTIDLVAHPDIPPELLFRAARTITRMLDGQDRITHGR